MRIFKELKIWMGYINNTFDNDEDSLTPIKISERDYKSLCKIVKEYKEQEGEDADPDWELFFNEFLSKRNSKLYNKILDKVIEEVDAMFDAVYDNINNHTFGEDYGFYIDGEMFEE